MRFTFIFGGGTTPTCPLSSYLILWVDVNSHPSVSAGSEQWDYRPQISADGLDLNQSHLNMNSPRCGLLCNAIALILADPNAVMMEDGQTYNPWEGSRTGGNPFRWMNHRLSDEEIQSLTRVCLYLGNGTGRCSLLILWESSEDLGCQLCCSHCTDRPAERTPQNTVIHQFSRPGAWANQDLEHMTFKGSREKGLISHMHIPRKHKVQMSCSVSKSVRLD